MQIPEQELRLLVKSPLDRFRRFGIAPEEVLREADGHFTAVAFRLVRASLADSLCREAMNSECVRKGP